MKPILYIMGAFITATAVCSLYFLHLTSNQLTIQKDSTAYYKAEIDTIGKWDEKTFVEMNKEIKYWKDTAFFYCGKYYEQLRVHTNHINNVQTLIQQ